MFEAVFWLALVKVLTVNLILSGDNAVVIAMAARSLQGSQRRQAIAQAEEVFVEDETVAPEAGPAPRST